MIGKIIGAIAGSQASKHVRGLNGTGGALLGAAVPILLRRLSPLTLIAVAAGAYAAKKHADGQKRGHLKVRSPDNAKPEMSLKLCNNLFACLPHCAGLA